MEEFDKELAQYGILAKNAQKLIEKERLCIFGNAEIETIDIKILQEKDIKCLDIKSKKIKNIIFVKDISLDMFFSGVTFTNEIKTDSKFTGELDFSGCTFKEEVNFKQANFKNFLCAHTTFEKQVSFLSAVFGNEKIISFSDVKFLNSAIFTNAIFNSDMDFYKVFFQKRLSFSRAKFNCNKAKFNIECKDEAWFIGVAGKNITIIESNFENNLTLGVTFDLLNIIDSEILKDLTLNNSTGNNIGIINSTIEKNTDLSFLLTKNIFLDDSTFKGEVKLSINGFLDMQNINFKNITFGKLYIPKEIFEKSVNFERCVFLQDINFKDHTFNEIAFNTCTFKESAYFNNSNFTKGVDFHECEFEKTACFYGVKFDETPNFSQAIFKGNLNAVNTNLNFTFDNLQERIKQEYKDFNKAKKEEDQKSLDKFANDFRDSFRNFKNALIKDNNLLDASKFHKYELYCKEIELNSNDTLLKYERDEVFDKLSLYLKQKVDWCLLLFYRKLSDHHTDLLKVLNNFFILIAVYYVYIITNTKLLEEKDIISSFLKSFSFYGDDKIVAVAKVLPLSYLLLLFFSPIVIFLASLYYTTNQKREIIFEKIKTKFQRCLLAASVFIVICLMLFVINSSFFIPLIKIVIFCGVFFLAIYINSLYLRYYFAISSYIVFSIVIVHYPIILNPLIGKILNDKIKIEDSLTLVITFAYTVLMFLVLFSLQKTARKNSIVPS